MGGRGKMRRKKEEEKTKGGREVDIAKHGGRGRWEEGEWMGKKTRGRKAGKLEKKNCIAKRENGEEDKRKEGECIGERDSVKHEVGTPVGGREKKGAKDKLKEGKLRRRRRQCKA